jgi:single-strand DNA-binding protein
MANLNLNKVILGGRLTADPELKTTQSGISVTSFSVAVNRRGKSGEETQADFFNVTAWRAQAELVTKFFRKGSSIALSGSIQNRTWTDNNGQKRYSTDIIADEIYFVDSKAEGGDRAAYGAGTPQMPYTPDSYQAPAFSSDSGSMPRFEDMGSDDDLPF